MLPVKFLPVSHIELSSTMVTAHGHATQVQSLHWAVAWYPSLAQQQWG